MVNKRIGLGILSMVLVFGMSAVECVNAQTDNRLNGTWIFKSATLKYVSDSELRKMLSSLVYLMPDLSAEDREQAMAELRRMDEDDLRQMQEYKLDDSRETYKNSEIKLNNGNYDISINGNINSKGIYITRNGKITQTATHINGVKFDLESKMYTINEFKKAFEEKHPGARFALLFDPTVPKEQDYSVNGNILTLTDEYGVIFTYTRK